MTTLFVLLTMWATGSPNNPVMFRVDDHPYRWEEQCEAKAQRYASEDLMAHKCLAVPVPLKEQKS